jgi:Ran GTPase-activating protein (RanGAP) involved in mRNA processing and transport
MQCLSSRNLQLIKGSESLKKLGLSNNEIGKVGCQALTAAISSNQSLKHLQLLPGTMRTCVDRCFTALHAKPLDQCRQVTH